MARTTEVIRSADRRFPGLLECLEIELMRRLQAAGITWLNVGGSEVRSLHIFKRKPAPVEERPMKLLVYGVS